MQNSVYWIRHPEMKYHMTEGYVGISNRPDTRFLEHRTEEWFDDRCEMVILQEGLTRQEAKDIETLLRPKMYIGWNKAKGGGDPPRGVHISPEKSSALRKKELENGTHNFQLHRYVLTSDRATALNNKRIKEGTHHLITNPPTHQIEMCLECEMVSGKSQITRHQNVSGHTGRVYVGQKTDANLSALIKSAKDNNGNKNTD